MGEAGLSLYGLDRPAWYVRRRGLSWARVGLCPCCYSSPPRQDCPICSGDYGYGPLMPEAARRRWRDAWLDRCNYWRVHHHPPAPRLRVPEPESEQEA